MRSGRRRSHGTTGGAGKVAGRREMKAAARTRRLRGGRPRAGGARAAAAAGWAAGARIGLRGSAGAGRSGATGGVHGVAGSGGGATWQLRIGPGEVAAVADIVRRGGEVSGGAERMKFGFHPRISGGEHIFIGSGS